MAEMPCHHCGYDLTGIAVSDGICACPECGKKSPTIPRAQSPVRVWLVPAIGLVASVVAIMLWTLEKAEGNKWAVVGVTIFFAPVLGALNGVASLITRRTIKDVGSTSRGFRDVLNSLGIALATVAACAAGAMVAGELAAGAGC